MTPTLKSPNFYDSSNISVLKSPNFYDQLVLEYDKSIVPILSTLYHSTETIHYVIKDSYANLHGSWAMDGMLYSPGAEEYHKCSYDPRHFDFYEGNLRYVDVEEVIIAASQDAMDNYGHFMLDKLGTIMLLPEDVIKRSYILTTNILPCFTEFLNIVGFSQDHILYCDRNDWIYAKKLHVFTKYRPINCFGGPPIYKLHKLFRKYFNLDLIEPTKYAFCNRKAKSRVISNFHELMDLAKTTFPDYNFEEIPDDPGNTSETAKLWATLRFIFVIIGSNASKGIFMKEGTVMCMASCEYIDPNLLNTNVGSHHAVYIFYSGISHFKPGSSPIDLKESIAGIRICLYFDKNHCWP